jgi:putative transposase
MRYIAYQDRRKVASELRAVYTAPNADAALAALVEFSESPMGRKYPAAVKTWEDAWERFTPFLAFPAPVRKVIHTTNAIESLNYQLRKIIKNRGHFPNDAAAVKLLWLAIVDIEDKRARQRAKQADAAKPGRNAKGRLIEGRPTQGWPDVLGALAIAYPDRFNNPIN